MELYHYGVPGMKWGVRRYQNEDGSLTTAGRARVARESGSGYLNPAYKDIKSGKAIQRKAVSKAYADEYWKKIDAGMPENEPSDEGRKLWNKYKDKYAAATLADLKLIDTKEARSSVKKLLSEIDAAYKYDRNDEGYSNSREMEFHNHRKEVEHPHRTKALKVAKKLGSATKIAADTVKYFN